MVASFWDKVFKDKQGKVVLWQKPGLPLIIWLAGLVLSKILPYGQANFIAAQIAFGAIFTWAWLEIFQGVNYFRRALGLVVMLLTILSRL